MATQPDIRLYGRDGHLVLVADIRAKQGTSVEWAAMLRRNLLEGEEFPAVKFFLIATPDRLYLWKDSGKDPVLVPPTYIIDARSALKPYFERLGNRAHISKEVFELLVTAWLSGLVYWRESPKGIDREQGWLTESRFLDAIKNGWIEVPAAA